MNPAHLHLAINHLPVVGLLLALGVLICGRCIKNEATMRVGFWLFIASALFAIPAYVSGEPAEDMVEKLPGIAKAYIERHESAAAASLAATLLVGAIAASVLFQARNGRTLNPAGVFIVMLTALLAFGGMAYAAKLGGEIHHQEIRSGSSK